MKTLVAILLVAAIYAGSMPLFFAVTVFALIGTAVQVWTRRVAGSLSVSRHLESQRLFFGESATITLRVRNRSGLPAPWLRVREHVPAALGAQGVVSQVITLGARRTGTIPYRVSGARRGFHAVGPLRLTLGDVFGLAERELQVPGQQYLIVYPRLLTARELELPSLAPFGSVRSRRHLLGDPARVVGVRDYLPGDPLHDIHWSATAAAGSLQVKQYQPTTTIQTMIALDLQAAAYPIRGQLALPELAVSVAATVASRLIASRQEVGLVSNGRLLLPPEEPRPAPCESPERWAAEAPPARELPAVPLPQEERMQPPLLLALLDVDEGGEAATPQPLPPARGRAQQLRLLEVLARIQIREAAPDLMGLLAGQGGRLPWGSTVVVITGLVGEALFLSLHRLREAGLQVVLYAVGRQPHQSVLESRARSLGVHLRVVSEQHQEGIQL